MGTESLGYKWTCDRCGKQGVVVGRGNWGEEPHQLQVFGRRRHDSSTRPDALFQWLCQGCSDSMIEWWQRKGNDFPDAE